MRKITTIIGAAALMSLAACAGPETETEAEAEAEVGFQAAAISGAASAAGYDNIKAETDYRISPYYAAVASGSGQNVTLTFSVPLDGEPGEVIY